MDLDAFAASIVERAVPFVDKGRDRDGIDCWGLVLLAYREIYGIELPPMDGAYKATSDRVRLEEVVRREQVRAWRRVEDPKPGDVVVFWVADCGHARRCASHVGLVLGGGRMLHAQEGTEACVEHYDRLVWQRHVEGFWRHESRA